MLTNQGHESNLQLFSLHSSDIVVVKNFESSNKVFFYKILLFGHQLNPIIECEKPALLRINFKFHFINFFWVFMQFEFCVIHHSFDVLCGNEPIVNVIRIVTLKVIIEDLSVKLVIFLAQRDNFFYFWSFLLLII